MKKFILGVVLGSLLASGFTVYAESMKGKVVDGNLPLKINGSYAPRDVIVIEGSSYLPVRAAGDLLGFNVDFVNNEVVLNGSTKQQGPLSVVEHPIKNNVADLTIYENDPVQTITADGVLYVVMRPFGPFMDYTPPNKLEFKFKQGLITIFVQDRYSPGVDGFSHESRFYIRPAALGLKAELIDGVVNIGKL